MRGNHHDAWVNGANDPVSGSRLLEEARAFGEILKARLASETHIIYCGVGRRGADAARLNRVGERTPTNFSSTPSPTSTPMATGAVFWPMGDSHMLEAIRQ